MKRLLTAIITPGVMLLLFASCEWHEYYDSYKNNGEVIYCLSEGDKYEVDLRTFTLCEGDFVYNDTITLDDAVQTARDGFLFEKSELVNISHAGNYEIRRFRYKAAFLVYITSYAHCAYEHHLPFEFEADELWLKGKHVIQQPFTFEKGKTEIEEKIFSEGGEYYAEYWLNFPITVSYRYNGEKITEFKYLYHVMRNNTTVMDGIPNTSVTIHINYDYQSEIP